MAWVKSEYAGELAVLSTWLVAIAPWSISVFGSDDITGVVFRFLPFRIQYLFGIRISNELTFIFPWQAVEIQGGNTQTAAYLWVVALVVFAIAFAASLYYYNNETAFEERLPIDPVPFFGGLLGVAGLLLLAGTVLLNLSNGFAGTTIPVGALVAPVLAGVLLTADRT